MGNYQLYSLDEKRVNWLIFAFFSFLLFIKCCVAHFYISHSILISSLWLRPMCFFAFYIPKISISLFLGSFVFWANRKIWIIVLSFMIDIWLMANIIYFRIYEGVIDGYVLMMAGNLRGFAGSIMSIIERKDFIFPILSVVFALFIYFLPSSHRNSKTFFGVFLTSYSMLLVSISLNYMLGPIMKKSDVINPVAPIECYLNPFSQKTRILTFNNPSYYDYSLIHVFFFAVNDVVSLIFNKEEIPDFSIGDKKLVDSLLGTQYADSLCSPLILIVFESLEDWVVQPEYMPATYRLISSPHSFHAHKLRKQTKYGGSADGQMIINTGLLPISKDAACFRYPFNTYPSLPKHHAVTLIPHPIDVWNQKCMSPAYGYDTTLTMPEQMAFEGVPSLVSEGYDMIQIITMASHEPFGAYSDISLPNGMPSTMAAYIRSVNCTDNYIGQMLDSLEQYDMLKDATIVITGDHTIFHKEKRDRFVSYCEEKNLHYGVEGNFCPLIIYSPNIQSPIESDNLAYQMDVYPTILGVLGYDNYYWKGLGVNLLDSFAVINRCVSEEEAYQLSDILIRSDFFANRGAED